MPHYAVTKITDFFFFFLCSNDEVMIQ